MLVNDAKIVTRASFTEWSRSRDALQEPGVEWENAPTAQQRRLWQLDKQTRDMKELPSSLHYMLTELRSRHSLIMGWDLFGAP
jgi:hypothetical protein